MLVFSRILSASTWAINGATAKKIMSRRLTLNRFTDCGVISL
jgi:hypothetical protein